MANLKDKISNLINSQVPDFVLEDHPLFLEFVKAYYTFLESAEITLTNIGDPDHIQLETQTSTNNFLQLSGTNVKGDDANDRILLEDTSYGDFINGETITGQTSGATATVLIEDVDANARLFTTHQNKFIEGELIVGSSSAAEATILKYRANPIQNIQQLLDYPDPDKTIQGFLTKFRNAFLNTISNTLNTSIDKRKLIKNVKSLYRAKGTKRASEIFFKLLFNEQAEITFPKENILRASDGKWDTQRVARCTLVGNTDPNNLVGQTITQANVPLNDSINEATAIVESVNTFLIGGNQVVELVLGKDSIVGTFISGQNITGVDNTDEDILITLTLKGIINTKTITNDGSFYNSGDIAVVSGGGNNANIQVDTIGTGSIDQIYVEDGGTGYEINDVVNFSSGTAQAKVSVVNGGFTQEESTSTTDDHIVLEDETTRGDPYTGNKIVQESNTGVGDITDVRIVYAANGYSSLPTLTITSSGGSDASIFAYGNDIGKVLTLKTIEFGTDYQLSPTPPTLTLPTYLFVLNVSGSFLPNQTVSAIGSDGSTTVTATVVNINTDTNILKLSNASGVFGTDVTITSSGGATATIKNFDQATATSTVNSTALSDGIFINQDGHISEDSMRIQDSLLYQDYSYIIKVGESINNWRDTYKKTLHSAGFYFTGQVNIETSLSGRMRNVTGINTGITEQLFQTYNILYSTVFGRRLGTIDDGTSLRPNSLLGVDPDLTDSTPDLFTTNTRDVTLSRAYKLVAAGGIIKELTTIRSNATKYGVPAAGPTLRGINELILGDNYANQVRIDQLNDLRLTGTLDSSIDGETNNLSDFSFKLKTNLAVPSEIYVLGSDTFDETLTTFDATQHTVDGNTFDVTFDKT